MQPDSRGIAALLTDMTVPVEELRSAALEAIAGLEPHLSLAEVNKKYRTLQLKGIDYKTYLAHFRRTVLATGLYYRHKHVVPSIAQLEEWTGSGIGLGNDSTPTWLVAEFYKDKNYTRALRALGISTDKQDEVGLGLTEKQLLALSTLGNLSDRRALSTKLRAIGVTATEYQTWLSNPKFSELYRRQAEDLLAQAQPAVNLSLVQLATGNLENPRGAGLGGPAPDLNAIKYLNEITGRWDPNARQAMDVRIVITRIVEILTSEINDPDLLRRIGGKLALMASSLGINSGSTGSLGTGNSIEGTSEEVGSINPAVRGRLSI